MLWWYEGADRGCRHKIFGDIFFFDCVSSAGRAHGDFPAHDPEQAFLSGIEHAGS
jgi:hypothetical protein